MFPIQISGKILKNLEAKTNKGSQQDELVAKITNDGSFSLLSNHYKEAFHSRSGAKEEAEFKYLAPAQLNRIETNETINILDVCFGMGYNSGCLIEQLNKKDVAVSLWGLEIDYRPLSIALQSEIFLKGWSRQVVEIFQEIQINGEWKNELSSGKILWGDARNNIHKIPKENMFDLILLDPFSPSNCPELWSEEFLIELSSKLKSEGKLITYCTAAAIRGSLKRAGLSVNSLVPKDTEKSSWSSGTIGILNPKNIYYKNSKSVFGKLSKMEEEHLLTKAGIPYRDPSGCSTAKEIIDRRTKAQKSSSLESSTSWKKRWHKADLPIKG